MAQVHFARHDAGRVVVDCGHAVHDAGTLVAVPSNRKNLGELL